MTGKASFSAKGGWVDSSTSTYESYDSRIGSTDTSFRQTIIEKGEVGLYADKQFEFNENPLYEFAIRFLAASLLDFDLSGPGKDAIKKYQTETNPTFMKELYNQTVSAIRDGAGYLLKFYNTKDEIRQFKWDPTSHYRPEWVHRKPKEYEDARDAKIDENSKQGDRRWVQLSIYDGSNTIDDKTESKWRLGYYIREFPCLEFKDYRAKDIAMLRLLDDEEFPGGRAIGRSCYQSFKSLNQALKDVMAIIKKQLSVPLVAKLDLDDVDDAPSPTTGVNLRDEASQAFSTSFAGINWAKNDIVAFDKKHEVGYLGLISGAGSDGGGKILNMMEHIEPVLSACLLNYFVPIGLIEQTGANKSIIAQQVLQGRKDMIPLKESMSIYLKTQVYPHITEDKVEIFYPPNGVSYEMLNTFFSTGLTSREYTTDLLGIVDHGKTFVPIEKPMAGGGSGGESNDDNPTKKRQESQGTKRGETGV